MQAGTAFDIRCLMGDDSWVRTTLDLDDDLLQAAKELAAARGQTAGQVISQLVRQALTPAPADARVRNGVRLFPPAGPGAPLVTMQRVNGLRED